MKSTTAKDGLALSVIPEGHDRQKFLGSSDIPALVGRCPKAWSRNTPLALWHDKITPRVQSEAPARGVLKRGKRWEGAVGEMLTEELERGGHKVQILNSNKRYQDPQIPYFAAEIDMEVLLDDDPEIVNVELKTVHPFKLGEWGESGSDEAPDWYVLQCWWGLGITGRKHTILAPLFGADELRTFIIERDDAVIGTLRDRGQRFWSEHVEKNVAPDPQTMADLMLLFPHEKPATIVYATDEVYEQCLELRSINTQINAWEQRQELLEYRIKHYMGANEALHLTGAPKPIATWKDRKVTSLDQTGLKEKYPKIHKEFVREGKARVFLLKQSDGD
jgi:predicted phage-related endonuclease